ncbi:polysaccharide deacetylase family protein [Candidatus Woesearchaeota archaeon]|nr:polysaccharide deacetylase family protein [Candidatus Woesearchaeota archaeon]
MKISAHYIIGAFLIVLLAAYLYPRAEPKEILLSFDTESVDGQDVLMILGLLEKMDVKATFFMTGEYADQYPEIADQIAENNEVACHSYDHPRMSKITREEKEEQIEKCIKAIEKATGKRPIGFRAPYHDIDKETVEVLKENGFEYDASTIENWGISFPEVKMTEVKISSYGLFPMSDVILRYYLKMPKSIYLHLMTSIQQETISLSFHPHHAVKLLEEIEETITYYQDIGTEFKTHSEYLNLS